ncbi:putative motility protein [Salinicola sp. RZ23]|uniref:putative motility protein n=1 Tax=Salinicola sp. RZ23 TaxID=1949087 RepID=UPI000DA21EDA|nr:putative motility protein [Salinicola sp. RZ23]
MDSAVNAVVGAGVALQQFNQDQDMQASLLKRSLDNQSAQVSQLMDSMAPEPKLAATGTVGTQINTYA